MFWTRVAFWRGNFVLYDGDDFFLPTNDVFKPEINYCVYYREKGVLI